MAYTTIDDPTAYFQTALYTGNGSTQSVTNDGNSNLQPDWVWINDRNYDSSQNLFDSVRGASKRLKSDVTDAEVTASGVTSFDTDGFTLGSHGAANANTTTYVGWQWKKTATAGFDIVSYTGTGSARTISHNLNAVPKWIICKSRSAATRWDVYHSSIGATKHMRLNTTDAERTSSAVFNNTEPTSSVFSLGNGAAVNASSETFIAYLFSEIKGYSKFGSYTGNGNADGTFIYTGFKPAWFLIKSSSNAEQWEMVDNKRNTINPLNLLLYPDQSAAEFTGSTGDRLHCDFVSNGVKLRGNASSANGSGLSYIYMAFAENPFVTSTGIPTTAR